MSVAAFFTNLYLKHRVRAKPGTVVNPAAARKTMKAVALRQKPPPADVRHTPVVAAEGRCPAEWLELAAGAARTVLYFHGGGYFFCDLETHRPLTAYLARSATARVLSVDYRLAPEAPFPAAVDDALAWYRHLVGQVGPKRLVLGGDSAGGGLALACLLAARDAGLPMPAGAVLFSPWTDLSCSGPSMVEQAEHDVMFRVEHLPQAAALYLGTTEARTPLASPLFADLAGLPPLAVFASRVEVLRSDSERLHERARAAGVDCSLTLEASLPHAWPVMVALPEARATLRAAGAFITARTSGTHPG